MAWNEPGDQKGKDNDPWSNGNKGGGNNQSPPDLDAALSSLMRKLGGSFGGGGSRNNRSQGFGFGALLVLGIVIMLLVFSGIYTVKEAERGVLLRFGKFAEIAEPGLHWRIPFVESVTNVNVSQVLEITAQGEMLTEDENIVLVEMNIQYRIYDPERYLYAVVDADSSLLQATDSALRAVIGHTSMDEILTTGREQVRQDTREQLEAIIKPYDMGLEIRDVNFLPARPPAQVKDAFDDAIAAQEDEQRYIREAEAYAKGVEPVARGKVKRLEQEAAAYKEQKIFEAKGEVAVFEQLLPEYNAAPKVTRERLYLETMQSVYSSTSKVLIDAKGSGNMLYLPIDKLVQPQTTAPQSAPASRVRTSAAPDFSTPIEVQQSTPRRSTRTSRGIN